jgi:hypothetical protein
MKYFPKMHAPHIERDGILDKLPAEKHPSVDLNKAVEDEQKLRLQRLNEACRRLYSTNQEAWTMFHDELVGMIDSTIAMDANSPMSMMGQGLNPEYFALVKAYVCGRKEVLQSIFDVIPDDLKKLTSEIEEVKEKTFVQKVVDLIFRK